MPSHPLHEDETTREDRERRGAERQYVYISMHSEPCSTSRYMWLKGDSQVYIIPS